MELKEFKNYVESFNDGTVFNYTISNPFSWRGSYDEVAFAITEYPMTKEDMLNRINQAYTGTFFGYKGGEYKYKDYTTVNFEDSTSNYTDGGYCSDWIAKIEDKEPFKTQQERLVKMMLSANGS
jgi:hypothetical protein